MKKNVRNVATLLALFLALWAMPVFAVETLTVVGVHMREDSVGLFISGAAPDSMTARISEWESEFTRQKTDARRIMRTLFLIDTSTSVQKISQDQIKTLLSALVEDKPDNSVYAIASFGSTYRLLLDFSGDRYDLSKAVQALDWNEQSSNIYQGIQTAAEAIKMNKENDTALSQIVVLSDGVEDSPTGVTREELFYNLAGFTLPVHTVGFKYDNNAEGLRALSAISRVSGGVSFTVSGDTEIMSFRNVMQDYQDGLSYVEVILPEAVKDGAVRPLRLFDENGGILLQYDLYMPGSQVVADAEETEVVQDDAAPSAKSGFKPNQLFIIAVVAVVLLLAILAALFMWWRKKKRDIQPKIAPSAPEPDLITPQHSFAERWNPLDENKTQSLITQKPTMSPGGRQKLYLILNDLAQPNRRFKIQVEDIVEIGREPLLPGIKLVDDKKISRHHCSVTRKGEELWIKDLGSINKTFINDEAVDGERILNDNDILTCGKSKFAIKIEKR